jgi:hypothetical protein
VIAALAGVSRRFRSLLGINRAIAFTVMARSWTILSGALTVLLIARFLGPGEQGYYYTFSSLVALQVVFELGFSFVILQLAAHESASLRISANGEISGDQAAHARLASVLQKAVRWYSAAALVMASALLAAGFHFFSTHTQSAGAVHWRSAWICIVIAATFTFQMDPIFSFLEGCGLVPQVAHMRFAQAVTGSALGWTALATHHGLFAPAGIISGQAGAGFVFLVSKRHLLLPLLRHSAGALAVSWRTEIFPFQWRIAVSFFCSYFIFPLFNPVIFAYRGAAEAGRMGMSLTIATSISTLAFAWINTKASPFGNMIARRDFATLDHVFFRAWVQSGALLLSTDAAFLCVLMAITRYLPRLASRMLPIPLFALLMFTIFLNHVVNCEAVYLRAHKREPFLVLAILAAVLIASSTLITGRLWGVAGVIIGYFICGGLLYVAAGTAIFARCRRLWHDGSAQFPSPHRDTMHP